MLKIKKYVTASPEQLEMVIEGMRNPYDSWDLSDSSIEHIENPDTMNEAPWQFHLGEKDHDLMTRLAKGGPVHAKYRRMIPVWVTITAPLYWWKEFDTYKVGTVCNSCSTMHKIAAKEFTFDDFSCENLMFIDENTSSEEIENHIYYFNEFVSPKDVLKFTIGTLNHWRERYLEYDKLIKKSEGLNREALENLVTGRRKCWDQLIQLLPTSYNQTRTIMLTYEVLHNIYESREGHPLGEWATFLRWIESLKYSDLITGKEV